MKKLSIVAALTLTFVLVFAMSALAALTPPGTATQGGSQTTSTTANYSSPTGGTTFNNDGAAGQDLYGPANQANTAWSAISGFTANQNVVGGAPSTTGDSVVAGYNTPVTRIHSNYAKNTNACASCHATHTAVGKDLLQWNGETETCMACHDGTAGVATYDVSSGHIGSSTAITNGGVFPTVNQTSKSMHDVFGGVDIKAAPGGNFGSSDPNTWGAEFNCVSCHNPHGMGANFRILNPNVNGFADNHKAGTYNTITKKFTAAVAMTDVSTKPSFAAPATGYKKFAYKAQYRDVYSGNPFYANFVTAPYPHKVSLFTDAAMATALTGYTASVENGAYIVTVPDTTTAVYVTGYVALPVKGNINGYLTANEQVTYVNGFNDFCGACHVDYNTSMYYTGSPTSMTTNTDGTPVTAAQKTYTDLDGNKILIPRHAVDFATGVYTQAYRHTVGFDAGADGHGGLPAGLQFEVRTYKTTTGTVTSNFMSCMTCHVAHGTDDAWWQAYGQKTYAGVALNAFGALPQPGAAAAEVFSADNTHTTPAGSATTFNTRGSNLKRVPNMGACEACHNKASGAMGYNISTNNY